MQISCPECDYMYDTCSFCNGRGRFACQEHIDLRYAQIKEQNNNPVPTPKSSESDGVPGLGEMLLMLLSIPVGGPILFYLLITFLEKI
jgi:hypothetical protein